MLLLDRLLTSCRGVGWQKQSPGGFMSFGKAVDLLRLAMMATSRQGVTLSDVEEEFGGVRRTAQRMLTV